MEGQSAQPPLKVCPHCSVASRTDSETCPSCGKPYARQRRWGVWIAVAIIVAAFAVGYGGRKLIQEDSEEAGITFSQGKAVEEGVSESQLSDRVGGEDPEYVKKLPAQGDAQQTCQYYSITDREGSLWQFCFVGGKLVAADAVK
jgi:RNA polymerase subunit RPABC4/transcription elongation factor Spt4